MNEQFKQAASHPATKTTAAGGGLLAVVLVLVQAGVFDRFAPAENKADLRENVKEIQAETTMPRLLRLETELDLEHAQSRIDRIEISVSNLSLLQEEAKGQNAAVVDAVRDLVEELKKEP